MNFGARPHDEAGMPLGDAADLEFVDGGVGLEHRHLLDNERLHFLVRVGRLGVDSLDNFAIL